MFFEGEMFCLTKGLKIYISWQKVGRKERNNFAECQTTPVLACQGRLIQMKEEW